MIVLQKGKLEYWMKNLLINLFLIFAFFVTGNQVFAQDIKFVQVTDVHYASNNKFSQEILENAVDEINSLKDVSFVVFTGDNINRPKREDLVGFVRTANKLEVPYYLAFGDHDVYKAGGLSKVEYLKTVKMHNWFYKPLKPNYVVKKKGFVFIVLDGAKEVIPGSIGYYKENTLEWLDKQLSKYKRHPVVILQHYPLLPPKELKSHRVYQAEKYFEVLDKHKNVIAIVSGHYHMNGEKMQNGVYHISTPSLLKSPNYFKVIEIVTTKEFSPMIYTELKLVETN